MPLRTRFFVVMLCLFRFVGGCRRDPAARFRAPRVARKLRLERLLRLRRRHEPRGRRGYPDVRRLYARKEKFASCRARRKRRREDAARSDVPTPAETLCICTKLPRSPRFLRERSEQLARP